MDSTFRKVGAAPADVAAVRLWLSPETPIARPGTRIWPAMADAIAIFNRDWDPKTNADANTQGEPAA